MAKGIFPCRLKQIHSVIQELISLHLQQLKVQLIVLLIQMQAMEKVEKRQKYGNVTQN